LKFGEYTELSIGNCDTNGSWNSSKNQFR
jgi:hypothetical protein